MLLGDITVNFGANLDGLQSGVGRAQGLLSGFASGAPGLLGGAIAAFTGLGAAAVGFGALSVSAAAGFQESMLKVQALAAPATENINQMKDAILAMAPAVGQGPKQLADGLYFIESAGLHGKAAIDLLRLSAEAASSGGIKDLKVVADAATSAINSYGQSNLSSKRAVDVMTATVSAGKMEWSSYAGAVSTLTSKASQGKVGFEEANAALAIFTRTGESAQLSANHLGSLMLYVGTQSEKMAANAKKMNIEFDASRFSTLNLGEKMQYLHDVTGGNFAEVQKLLGGNKTLASTYEKLYQNTSSYNDVLKQLKNSQGATDAAFAITSQGFNASMAKLNAAFDVLKITVGSALLPILTRLVSATASVVAGFTTWIQTSGTVALFTSALSSVANTVSNVFDTLFYYIQKNSTGFQILGQAIFSTVIPPFLTLAKVIGIVGGALIDMLVIMYQVSGVGALLGTLFGTLIPAFSGIIAPLQVSLAAVNALGDAIRRLGALIGGAIAPIVAAITQAMDAIAAKIRSLGPIVTILIGQLIASFLGFVASIEARFAPIFAKVQDIIAKILPIFDQLKAAFPGLLPLLGDLALKLLGLADILITNISNGFKTFVNWVMQVTAPIRNFIDSVIKGYNILSTLLAPSLAEAAPKFKALGDAISGLVGSVSKTFGETVAKVATQTMPIFVQVMEKALPVIIRVAGIIADGLAKAIVFLTPAIDAAIRAIGDFAIVMAQRVGPEIIKFFGQISSNLDWLQKNWDTIWAAFGPVLTLAWAAVVASFKIGWSLFSGIFLIALDLLNHHWDQVWVDMGNMLKGIWDGFIILLRGFYGTMVDDAVATGTKLLQALLSPFQQFGDQVHRIFNDIQQMFGGTSASATSFSESTRASSSPVSPDLLKHLLGFANGVQNFGGGLALVGERGPEVVSLPQGSNVYPNGTGPGGGSGGTQHIMVYLDSEVLAEAVGNKQMSMIHLRTGTRAA